MNAYFKKDFRMTIQQIGTCHKGLFERSDDLASVAYWYQDKPAAHQPPLPGRDEREII